MTPISIILPRNLPLLRVILEPRILEIRLILPFRQHLIPFI